MGDEETAAAVAEAPIGILRVAADGRVTAANPAAVALGAIAGADWTGAIHPEDRPLASAARQAALDDGRAAIEASLLARERDPRARRAPRARITLTRADDGGHRVFLEDVSGEAGARAQLADARRELEDARRGQAELVSLLAHELHEPLRKITGFAGHLRDATAGRVDADATDALARIERAAERMRALLEGLLELGRAATAPLARAPVELDEVVAGVVAALEARIAALGATVEVGPLPTIEGDLFQMEQLFSHLVRNALDFRREGAAPTVRVFAVPVAGGRGAGRCAVAVADDGEGLGPQQTARIFGAFQRVHGRGGRGGAGLGLAICKTIVERHGGSIEACSAPGAGATFTITLPRA